MMFIPKKQNNYSGVTLFNDLDDIQKEINRLFDFSMGKSASPALAHSSVGWIPSIDVVDTKDNLCVKADLPGLTKDELNVEIEDDVLTIKGERKRESEVKEGDYLRTERYFGCFYRSVQLPASIDASRAIANFKNGVLELTLPKKEEAKPKQIKVEIK